jgi:hypothetical protein
MFGQGLGGASYPIPLLAPVTMTTLEAWLGISALVQRDAVLPILKKVTVEMLFTTLRRSVHPDEVSLLWRGEFTYSSLARAMERESDEPDRHVFMYQMRRAFADWSSESRSVVRTVQ